MTPSDAADAVAAEAVDRDLVVGPVVMDGSRVVIYLSAAHRSGRTAVIETDGAERLSLVLDDFRWPGFAYEAGAQSDALREVVALAAMHLFGHTKMTRRARSWPRRDAAAFERTWQGTSTC